VERHAYGSATDEELAAAGAAARAAAWPAAGAAAWPAARAAAWDAAWDAARDAQKQELLRVLGCMDAGQDPYSAMRQEVAP
jgi:hypothetical protein